MTAIICESFSWYGSSAAPNAWLVGKWTACAASSSAQNVAGRIAGRALNMPSNNANWLRYGIPAGLQDDCLFIGCGAKFATATLFLYLRGDANATTHVIAGWNSADASISIYRGTTSNLLGKTAAGTFPSAEWHYFELKARLSDSTTDLEVRIDGITSALTNGPSYDTKNAGTATVFDNVAFGASVNITNAAWIDDVYVLNEADTINNDFLGDCYVECHLPSGNGSSSQFVGSDSDSTDNYALVQEQPPDEDTTYVESSTDNNKDLYVFPDLSSTAGEIAFVQVTSRAEKTDTGTRNLALVSHTGSAEVDSGDFALANAAYGYQRNIWELQPDNSTAWTIAVLNSGAEFGIKCRP